MNFYKNILIFGSIFSSCLAAPQFFSNPLGALKPDAALGAISSAANLAKPPSLPSLPNLSAPSSPIDAANQFTSAIKDAASAGADLAKPITPQDFTNAFEKFNFLEIITKQLSSFQEISDQIQKEYTRKLEDIKNMPNEVTSKMLTELTNPEMIVEVETIEKTFADSIAKMSKSALTAKQLMTKAFKQVLIDMISKIGDDKTTIPSASDLKNVGVNMLTG